MGCQDPDQMTELDDLLEEVHHSQLEAIQQVEIARGGTLINLGHLS